MLSKEAKNELRGFLFFLFPPALSFKWWSTSRITGDQDAKTFFKHGILGLLGAVGIIIGLTYGQLVMPGWLVEIVCALFVIICSTSFFLTLRLIFRKARKESKED